MKRSRTASFGLRVASLLLATAASANAQLSNTPQEDRRVLSGVWKLVPELSDDPRTTPSAGRQGEPQGPPPGGGRGPGGMGRGGGMGGQRGMPGEPGQAPNENDVAYQRALTAALMAAPTTLVISVGEDQVTFTETDGRVQHFGTTNKKEKHTLGNGTVETRTKWDKSTLVKEIALAEGSKATETYLVTEAGQLQVTVRLENPRMGKPLILKRVYEDAVHGPGIVR